MATRSSLLRCKMRLKESTPIPHLPQPSHFSELLNSHRVIIHSRGQWLRVWAISMRNICEYRLFCSSRCSSVSANGTTTKRKTRNVWAKVGKVRIRVLDDSTAMVFLETVMSHNRREKILFFILRVRLVSDGGTCCITRVSTTVRKHKKALKWKHDRKKQNTQTHTHRGPRSRVNSPATDHELYMTLK